MTGFSWQRSAKPFALAGLTMAGLTMAGLTMAGCKPRLEGSTLAGAVPKAATPPKISYHFGDYSGLSGYGKTGGAPSDDAWQKIPSVRNPPGGAYRAGLYVAQHPGYSERYASEKGGVGAEPWMMTVLLDDECVYNTSRWFDLSSVGLGGDCPPERFRPGAANASACLDKASTFVKDNGIGIMVDTWWPELGFWYVTDRSCVRSLDATPDGFLQAAGSVPDFWASAPYTSDERRDKGAGSGYFPGEISFTILARAMTESTLANRRLLIDLAQNVRKSDLPRVKDPLVVLADYAVACFDARQTAALKLELTGFLAGLPKTAGAANGGNEEASERPNAEPNEEASKAGAGSGLSIASAIDDLARRRLAGLAGVCPGVKAKMTGVPPAPVASPVAPSGFTPVTDTPGPAPSPGFRSAGDAERVACTKFFAARGNDPIISKEACIGQSVEGIECVKFFNARGNALPLSGRTCLGLLPSQIDCVQFYSARGNDLETSRSGCAGQTAVGIECVQFYTARGNDVRVAGAACLGLSSEQIECTKFYFARGNDVRVAGAACLGLSSEQIECTKFYFARGNSLDLTSDSCRGLDGAQIECVKFFTARGNALPLSGSTCEGLSSDEIECVKSMNAKGHALPKARQSCH